MRMSGIEIFTIAIIVLCVVGIVIGSIHAPERKREFMDQCSSDGVSLTECEFMWSEMNRIGD